MSDDVARHYEALLAEHYTWMFGVPFEAKVAEQRALLEHLGFGVGPRGMAVDLGCGPGFQSVALAELGFARVLAVDTSPALLAELEAHRGDHRIEALRADLRDLAHPIGPGEADAVVCMGDTLTHLACRADVPRLFAAVHRVLASGGLFALTFRDLSAELAGLERFVPVRGDADRVMTCFLEYEPEAVVVHDLVNVRDGAGWTSRKSSYRKLRLAPEQIAADLAAAGFAVCRNEPAACERSLQPDEASERPVAGAGAEPEAWSVSTPARSRARAKECEHASEEREHRCAAIVSEREPKWATMASTATDEGKPLHLPGSRTGAGRGTCQRQAPLLPPSVAASERQ